MALTKDYLEELKKLSIQELAEYFLVTEAVNNFCFFYKNRFPELRDELIKEANLSNELVILRLNDNDKIEELYYSLPVIHKSDGELILHEMGGAYTLRLKRACIGINYSLNFTELVVADNTDFNNYLKALLNLRKETHALTVEQCCDCIILALEFSTGSGNNINELLDKNYNVQFDATEWAVLCDFLLSIIIFHDLIQNIKTDNFIDYEFNQEVLERVTDNFYKKGSLSRFLNHSQYEAAKALKKENNRINANKESRPRKMEEKAAWLEEVNLKYNKDIHARIQRITQKDWAEENLDYVRELASKHNITDSQYLNISQDSLVRKLKKDK